MKKAMNRFINYLFEGQDKVMFKESMGDLFTRYRKIFDDFNKIIKIEGLIEIGNVFHNIEREKREGLESGYETYNEFKEHKIKYLRKIQEDLPEVIDETIFALQKLQSEIKQIRK